MILNFKIDVLLIPQLKQFLLKEELKLHHVGHANVQKFGEIQKKRVKMSTIL
jgi:hypothetical protein